MDRRQKLQRLKKEDKALDSSVKHDDLKAYISESQEYIKRLVEDFEVILNKQSNEAYDRFQEVCDRVEQVAKGSEKEKTDFKNELLAVSKTFAENIKINAKEIKIDPPKLPEWLEKDDTFSEIKKTLEKINKSADDPPTVAIAPDSQAARDFIPFRRVIKQGNRTLFDDLPSGGAGGGAGPSLTAFVGADGNPVDVSAADPLPVDATIVTGDIEIGAVELKNGTDDTRATVTAANALKVDGSAVTQPVSGTVSVTPSGTQDINQKQVNGQTINVGTGAAGTGTQRVAVSSDSSITANAGTNLNTSALALESGGNLASIKTNTDKIPSQGIALPSASMPVVQAKGVVSSLNSTTTPLSGSATFTGSWEDVSAYDYVEITLDTDQNSGTNGATISFSTDGGTTTERTLANTILGGLGAYSYIIPLAGFTHMKIVYTNGSSGQSIFHLHTEFKCGSAPSPLAPLGATIDATYSAGLTRAVVAGQLATGAVQNLAVDSSGRLKIDVANHDVDTPVKSPTNAQAYQTTIATTATRVDASPLTNRKTISLKLAAGASHVVYVGFDNTVSLSTGRLLDLGDSIDIDLTEAKQVWAIADTSSQALYVIETAA